MLFVHSDIPTKLLSVGIGFESFFVKLSFLKRKWLRNCSHNPVSIYIES